MVATSVVAISGAQSENSSGSSQVLGLSPVAPTTTSQLFGWGSSENLQLLTPGTTNRLPLPLLLLGAPISIAAGSSSAYALHQNGTVTAWGNNGANQLGRPNDGSMGSLPAPVSGLPPVCKLFASSLSGFAITPTGTLWAWGYNGWGELGLGSNENAVTPTQVGFVGTDAKIIGGDSRVLLLKGDGTLWGSGYNYYWDLGLGDRGARNTFTQLPLGNVRSAAFGGLRSGIASTADGRVYTWGRYIYGDTYPTPTHLPELNGIVKVAGVPGTGFALSSSGTVYSWGANDNGQLGRSGNEEVPGVVSGLPAIADVFGSQGGTVYALGWDGSLWAWGNGDNGQIGDGYNKDRYEPVRVRTSGAVTLVAAGRNFAFAVSNQSVTGLLPILD